LIVFGGDFVTFRMLQSAALMCGCALLPYQLLSAPIDSFFQTNLTSDLPGVAANPDSNLVNPWGIAFSNTSPIWISDNHTGLATVYDGAGVPQGLVVTIPPPLGGTPPASPTGVISNSDMTLFAGSHFIFATEDGTISAWTGGTSATLEVDNSPSGAVYKGLAADGNLLYAANFNSGHVDVFTSGFRRRRFPAGSQTRIYRLGSRRSTSRISMVCYMSRLRSRMRISMTMLRVQAMASWMSSTRTEFCKRG
jgi:hypothetical protein